MKNLRRAAGVAVVAGITGVAGIVVARTLSLAPAPGELGEAAPAHEAARVTFDEDAAVARFAEALRYRTVSVQPPAESDSAAFLALHRHLERSYPLVHEHLARERVGSPALSLLHTWEGADPSRSPVVLMGHLDVVPVIPGTEDEWTHPPFAGTVADGAVWGRGAMDDKVSVLAVLQAVELLLSTGHRPSRTIYLAFGHDEELGGANGAGAIADLLESRGVRDFALVLDEGPGVTEGLVPGIDVPVAMVGVAEKGYLSLELTVRGAGGHSSVPPPTTAIGVLAEAISELEEHPFPADMNAGGLVMLEALAPHMALPFRVTLANRWLFDPLLARSLSGDPQTNALIRTTTAATMFSAGVKDNVLPIDARATVNFRILPGETVGSVIQRVREVIDDDRVTVAQLGESGRDPSPFSDLRGPAFRALEASIRQVRPGPVLVAPILLMGGTDAAYYAVRSSNVLRFLPVRMTEDDVVRVHGTDERLLVEDYLLSVRFFLQLVKNVDALP